MPGIKCSNNQFLCVVQYLQLKTSFSERKGNKELKLGQGGTVILWQATNCTHVAVAPKPATLWRNGVSKGCTLEVAENNSYLET